MIRKMNLKGKVNKNKNNLTFDGVLYDGTPFSLGIIEADLDLNENLAENVQDFEALLKVDLLAQQDARCSITLPQPTLRYGHQITVNRQQLVFPVPTSLVAKIQDSKKPKIEESKIKEAELEVPKTTIASKKTKKVSNSPKLPLE